MQNTGKASPGSIPGEATLPFVWILSWEVTPAFSVLPHFAIMTINSKNKDSVPKYPSFCLNSSNYFEMACLPREA